MLVLFYLFGIFFFIYIILHSLTIFQKEDEIFVRVAKLIVLKTVPLLSSSNWFDNSEEGPSVEHYYFMYIQ